MGIFNANIAPSVLGAAVINITGNLYGLRSAMSEARTQMYGMVTFANAIGGKMFGTIFSPIAIRVGMGRIAAAMKAGKEEVARAMGDWKNDRPDKPDKPVMGHEHPETWRNLNRYNLDMALYKVQMKHYREDIAKWMAEKPNARGIIGAHVQTAGLGAGKWLMFGSIIAAITAAFIKAIPYASEFTEQLNKTIHTFGLSTDIIMRGASKASSMGLSSAGYLKGTSTLGIELMGSGMSESESTALAEKLARRASDMASFYDMEVDTVLQKMMSGLAGMSRPLKELGINTQEGRVKLKALSMGFKEHNGELTEESKVKARAALILQMSNKAEGDFARTSGEYKNQIRELGAHWEELMIQIGMLGQGIATLLLPVVNKLVWGLNGLATAMNTIVFGIADLAKEFFSLIMGYGSYINNRQTIMNEERWGVSVDNYYEQKRLQELQNQSEELKHGSKHTDLLGYSKTLQDSVFKKDRQAEIAKDTAAIRKLMEQRNQMRNPGSDKAADFRLDLFMGNALIS